MSDTYDKESRLKIAYEDLEQARFKKTAAEKIAVRVGNEESDPLYVNVTEGAGESDLIAYGSVSAVAKDDETKIIEYIVPPSKTFNLDKVTASGENIGKYTVLIDGSIKKVLRTNYGGSLNVIFNFKSYEVLAGQKVEVLVEQVSLQGASTHEASIEGKIK